MLKSSFFILFLLSFSFSEKTNFFIEGGNRSIHSNEEIRGSDPIIRYGGKHAFLALSKISPRTFEITLSPLESIHGSEPELPGSDLLTEYEAEQIWKSRTVMDPVRGELGEYILEVLRSPLRLIFRKDDNSVIQELRWPDGEDGELQINAGDRLYGLESMGTNSGYLGTWIRIDEQSSNYGAENDETKDDQPFVLSGTDGWSVFIHQPAGKGNSFKLEDAKGTFLPDSGMLDSPVHIFITLWDNPEQIKTEFSKFAGEDLVQSVTSSDLTPLKE